MNDLKSLQIFSHFVHPRTEDGTFAFPIDSYLPLAGPLVGLSREAASIHFLGAGGALLKGQDDLLARVLGEYSRALADDTRDVVATSTFTLERPQAYSQALARDGRYRIDVSLPMTAVAAYLSFYFAQESHLILLSHKGGTNEAREDARTRVGEYLRFLEMVATATAQNGTVVFEDVIVPLAAPELQARVLEFFYASVGFLVLHELAHIRLRHHDGTQPDAVERRKRELEADRKALYSLCNFDLATPWSAFVGPLIVLLSLSLTSTRDDDVDSPTHPSLVHRYQNICEQFDRLTSDRVPPSRLFAGPYLTDLLANMHDRDRCVAWLGCDRRQALGLPSDHQFDYQRLDFKSKGQIRLVDVRREPARRRVVEEHKEEKGPPVKALSEAPDDEPQKPSEFLSRSRKR